MNQFTDIYALEKWLSSNGIDVKAWGSDNSKSLDNLWQELQAGEVQLKQNPPLRLVEVVQIIIRRRETVLVEAEQEFFNGQRRYRNQPPSEKIKPGETVQVAASRCLQEELGLSLDAFTLRLETHREYQTNTNSISYPGLPSQYNFHIIEAAVSGLPTEDFWRENESDGIIDPVKRHRWEWRPADSFPFIGDH
ncbi:MAG: NUDIX domain-containing protein [Anaerolineaceae bacterium]|nr:NUDIX domain-containing protein [Anaerolineaceae bacterium]